MYQQSFHGVANGRVLDFGIVGHVDRFLNVRIAVHVNVADALAVPEHRDQAVLHDVRDKFVRSSRHDQIDVIVHL